MLMVCRVPPRKPTTGSAWLVLGVPGSGNVHCRSPSDTVTTGIAGRSVAKASRRESGADSCGEEIREAAARELEEETGLIADVGQVVWTQSNFHDPAKLTVGIWFAGTVTGGTLQAGDDADDAKFFALDELPPLAFPTDVGYLRSLGVEVTLPDEDR